MISQSQLRKRIENCRESAKLMSWPQTYQQINAVIGREAASILKLSAIVSLDPALSAGILKVANSAYYGQEEVTSINRAIMVIGLEEFRRLATEVALIQQFKAPKGFDININDLWLHCIATARAANLIGEIFPYLSPEDLYTAGLLHDLGKLFMVTQFTDDVVKINELRKKKQLSWYEAEKEYGINHTLIGKVVAETWGLPPLLTKVIANHHNPDTITSYFMFVAIVYIADIFADMAGFSFMSKLPKRFAPIVMLRLQLTKADLKSCWRKFLEVVPDIRVFGESILA